MIFWHGFGLCTVIVFLRGLTQSGKTCVPKGESCMTLCQNIEFQGDTPRPTSQCHCLFQGNNEETKTNMPIVSDNLLS